MNPILAAVLILSSSFCSAQISERTSIRLRCIDEHLSQLPASASCAQTGSDYYVSQIVDSAYEQLEDLTEIEINGYCDTWGCEDPTPPIQQADCSVSVSNETCWTVGGTLGGEIKTGLLAKVLKEVGASFSISVTWTGCVTVAATGGTQGRVMPCEMVVCGIRTIRRTARKTQVVWDEVVYWDCTFDNGSILPVQTACGERERGTAEASKTVYSAGLSAPVECCTSPGCCGKDCDQ